eukprot:TRINITY_DN53261_c0_g1_i1.p1 TRINITY_DN53261_c0_g1~~TRINITY_DN53261_c0_g1_i1.p1  ORF type:complete len:382 (-),score=77.18 TRINITY_DN53261_c0_g1_i1:85-1158(-)
MAVTDEESRDIGLGLYLLGAAFNHDEEPNCVHCFVGRRLVIRTIRPVAEGEELKITYSEIAEISCVRRSRLQLQYHFDPCKNAVPPASVQERDATLCEMLVKSSSSSGSWEPLSAGVGWSSQTGVQDSDSSQTDLEKRSAEALELVKRVNSLWVQARDATRKGSVAESANLLRRAWDEASSGQELRLGTGHSLRLALAKDSMDAAIALENWSDAAIFARAVCICSQLVYPPSWPITCLSLARLAKLELYHGRFPSAIKAAEDALRGNGSTGASPEVTVWEDRKEAASELRQILAEARAEAAAMSAAASMRHEPKEDDPICWISEEASKRNRDAPFGQKAIEVGSDVEIEAAFLQSLD